jgi:hypothetical protein
VSVYRLERQIDRDAVARLNRLVAETRAKIVVSSSWRKLLDPPELHRVLVDHGLIAEIIGETPDGNHDLEMLSTFGHIDRIFRGHEIDLWLRRHPEVERFVILDDGSDMEMHKNRLVQTDCESGLLDEHVDLAIRVMSWDGKTIPRPEGPNPCLTCAGACVISFPEGDGVRVLACPACTARQFGVTPKAEGAPS